MHSSSPGIFCAANPVTIPRKKVWLLCNFANRNCCTRLPCEVFMQSRVDYHKLSPGGYKAMLGLEHYLGEQHSRKGAASHD